MKGAHSKPSRYTSAKYDMLAISDFLPDIKR